MVRAVAITSQVRVNNHHPQIEMMYHDFKLYICKLAAPYKVFPAVDIPL